MECTLYHMIILGKYTFKSKASVSFKSDLESSLAVRRTDPSRYILSLNRDLVRFKREEYSSVHLRGSCTFLRRTYQECLPICMKRNFLRGSDAASL